MLMPLWWILVTFVPIINPCPPIGVSLPACNTGASVQLPARTSPLPTLPNGSGHVPTHPFGKP